MNKSHAVLAVAAALLAQGSFAAEPAKKKAQEPGFDQVRMMKEKLNLSEAQLQKVKAIFEADKVRFVALRDNRTLSTDQKRQKLQEMKKASADRLKEVLTLEQEVKLKEELMRRMKEQGRVGKGDAAVKK